VIAIRVKGVKSPAMELRQLETFKIVMVTLNMTAAAKHVYRSPAAISLQLKQLSDEVGAELFTRVGRKLVPTPAAKRLEQNLYPLMGALRAIREDFPPEAELDTRPFVLASGITTLIYQLRQPLIELRRKFPKNDIQVSIGTTEAIIRGLESKRFDLGLVSLPVEDPAIQLAPLFREEMLFVTTLARQTTSHRKTIRLRDISEIPMILYPPSATTRQIIDQVVARHGLSLLVAMEADDTEAIKRLVEAGFGSSILPANALKDSRKLRTFRIAEERIFREVALATLPSPYPRRLTKAISEYLAKKLGGNTGAKETTRQLTRVRTASARTWLREFKV
jgi:DNA-binding transcriptional LysR family regulator